VSDIIIPGTNTATDAGPNKIPAGEKVLVIKTPKGVYIRTNQGKIFAVRTTPKTSATSTASSTSSSSVTTVARSSQATMTTLTNSSLSSAATATTTGHVLLFYVCASLGWNTKLQKQPDHIT